MKPGGVRTTLLTALLALAACKSRGDGPVRSFVAEPFPERLSEWNLFKGKGATLEPNAGVLPYALNSALFSDHAEKYRTLWVPPGQKATYHDAETFDFPVGTILSKTFMYPREGKEGAAQAGSAGNRDGHYRPLETRLLVRGREGWVALPYVWNEDGSEATLEVVGATLPVRWRAPSGEERQLDYAVPNVHQCQGCHERAKVLTPIGPKARHLNRDFPYDEGPENQLVRLTRAGVLSGAPEPAAAPRNAVWDDARTGSLEARARAYLDINCAHCHDRAGPAASSGLNLSALEGARHALGVCKAPVAAGRGAGKNLAFDIVPGQPERSILVYRMDSTDPGIMMPEVGRTVVHEQGVALVREWVARMEGSCEPVAGATDAKSLRP